MANASFVAAVLLLTLASSSRAQTPVQSDRYRTDLQPLIEKLVQEQHIAGIAIAIVEDDRVVYAQGFGVKNVTSGNDPVTPESLFHLASITKPFVATAIMQLVENRKMDLDAPVVRYLPYFKLADERYKIITVRQMLTHTSGMPDVEDYEWDKPQYDDGAAERYVRSMSNLKLEFEPGTKLKYSNMAFDLLGDLIAKVSGESFENYVQKNILTPLEMRKSTLLMRDADPKLLTWGHEREYGDHGGVIASKVFPYNRIHSPSSNLFSSVLDMTHWAMANLNHGEWHGRRILTESSYAVMWNPATEFRRGVGDQQQAVGISWFLGEYRGHKTVRHGGSDTGYLTDLEMIPDKKIAVIWMMNCSCGPVGKDLTAAALDVALGLKPKP
jgi:CubicO group peptidase (beta-lactamase class C family)